MPKDSPTLNTLGLSVCSDVFACYPIKCATFAMQAANTAISLTADVSTGIRYCFLSTTL